MSHLTELAMVDEALFHFDEIDKPIAIKEAMRIAEAVIENDSIWDEVYTLMQDIHEEE